jgi:hypothetical protein
MKSAKRNLRTLPALVGLLVTISSLAYTQVKPRVVEPAGVPNALSNTETQFQHETHFLTFIGSFVPESAQTAKAYYSAIDPTGSKATFQRWLVNAGFISNVNEWHASGTQVIACDLPGCDLPSHTNGSLTYGDNIINTDSHAIVLNAADLGFVRNQFIRCKPSCSAANPIIYTYLENYPVAPFAQGGSNFSNLNGGSSYPTQAESAAAIRSALTRPLGNLATCTLSTTENPLGCSIQRIADVAFEWAPPPTNLTSSARYGQLYAYVFFVDPISGNASETIASSPNLVGLSIPDFANPANTSLKIAAGDPFPPNLDFLGFKQHPGVCLVCHGGDPQRLTTTGTYPRQGNINGFRFLPLDIKNLIFTSDTGLESTSRVNQESQLKAYNLAVLKTVTQQRETDDQGTLRQPHLAEVIKGWYTNPGGPLFGRATQNADFIPVNWQEAKGAPAGSEQLYKTVVAPSCRSCHFNRELSLDFGTAANFKQESDLLQLALLPSCESKNPDPKKRPMPLAHLTYQRYWQANAASQTLPDGTILSNTADQIAQYFGFSSAAGYCATQR